MVLNPQAINIDARIQELQEIFADSLTWLTKAFGRSWKQFRKNAEGKTYTFPGVYAGKSEYFDCLPNDTLGAYCFFSHKDKAVPAMQIPGMGGTDYLPGTHNEWQHKVDIIFWFNQQKTNPGVDYPVTENLLAEVRELLRGCPFFTPTGVYYNADNIFDGYSLTHIEEQYLMHPFGGFRIEGFIQFLETDVFGECM